MKHRTTKKLSIRLVGYALILAVNFGIVELASYLLCQFVILQRAPYLLYIPPEINRADWQHYLEVRDPMLGWPTTDALKSERYDASGSRPVPAFPDPGNECVTLYGDSYTYGEEVGHKEAWGNVLAEALGCRVANFGVGGYGTDQALLRFEDNQADTAPVSILGILPINVMRNVNQYRYLRVGKMVAHLSFKPRFILVDGELRLVSKPEPTYEELGLLSEAPSQLLPHETSLPGAALGPQPLRFPYTLVVLKLLLFNEKVQRRLLKGPGWSGFVEKEHLSQAQQVTVAIVKRFREKCDDRGKKCFVLLFPSRNTYNHFIATGCLVTKPLTDEFDKLGIPYLDLVALFAERLLERSICEIHNRPEQCLGHFNAEGNRLVAEFVHAYMAQNDLHIVE